MSFGFYFSYTYDMTLSKEKQSQKINEPDSKFWWNQFLMGELTSQKIDRKWYLVVIQVYFLDKSFLSKIRGLPKVFQYI